MVLTGTEWSRGVPNGTEGYSMVPRSNEWYRGALQTIAAYLPCFGQALDKLQGKVVTHLEKLNGGEL